MKKFKVLSIFGTRPEAIKMCPLIKELNEKGDRDSGMHIRTAQTDVRSSVGNLRYCSRL